MLPESMLTQEKAKHIKTKCAVTALLIELTVRDNPN